MSTEPLTLPALASALLTARYCDEPVARLSRSTAYAALAPAAMAMFTAELRRLADGIDAHARMIREGTDFGAGEQDAYDGVSRTLRARADELDAS